MQALVIFESMFGTTHAVADHVADGLRDLYEVVVVPVSEASDELVAGADLVVVGGPTHVHGMSRDSTRADAVRQSQDLDKDLHLDPDAEGPGLREWFAALPRMDSVRAAAFDTRVDMSPVVTGRAAKGIAKRLRHHGFTVLIDPESFLVDKDTHLLVGEDARAQAWGAAVAAQAANS